MTAAILVGLALVSSPVKTTPKFYGVVRSVVNQVLEWNQLFIDTLIATNTANSSSQRLGAIVHTAIFDAFNGIERRYTPIFVHISAPDGASRRAAVIAARTRHWSACFRPDSRRSMPAMQLRSRR